MKEFQLNYEAIKKDKRTPTNVMISMILINVINIALLAWWIADKWGLKVPRSVHTIIWNIWLYITMAIIFFTIYFIPYLFFRSKAKYAKQVQANSNKTAQKILKENGFLPTKILYINDNFTYKCNNLCKKIIFADLTNQQLAIIDYKNQTTYLVDFSELLSCEIYENDASIFLDSRKVCHELKLMIRLNNYIVPQISYDVIFDPFRQSISKSSKAYKICNTTLQETVSFLEVLKNKPNVQG